MLGLYVGVWVYLPTESYISEFNNQLVDRLFHVEQRLMNIDVLKGTLVSIVWIQVDCYS